MCKEGDNPVGGNDRLVCGYEWNKAFHDSRNNRGWVVKMGPYTKGKFDDPTKAETAREGLIYDASTANRRLWVADQKMPPLDGTHKIWNNVQETVKTIGLKAPKGTKIEFPSDKEFCESGKWAAGQCL